jgi:hypothetical protein
MLKSKSHSLFGALAVIALTAGAGSSRADIIFGNFAAPPGPGASFSVGSGNFVADNTQKFTVGSQTYTATGYSGAPGIAGTETALTLKTIGSFNTLGESGLGENATFAGTPAACSDLNCEIGGSTSVGILSNTLVTDIIVGSVQGTESFKLYTGTSLATLATDGVVHIGGTASCPAGPDTDTCLFTLPGDFAVGVQNVGTGNVLVTELSAVPAPVIGHGLFVLLAIGGVLFGGKLLESFKKHRLQAV